MQIEKQQQIHQKVEAFSALVRHYEKYLELVGNHAWSELQRQVGHFNNAANKALEENRLLSIGVIGQIKRGKSSFLNALLFQGEDILPKAATPMTAALTKIQYRETPGARVEFYNEDEWHNIVKKAQQHDELVQHNESLKNRGKTGKQNFSYDEPVEISDDLKSCKELAQMAEARGLELHKLLGSTKEIEGVQDLNELIGKLEEFVGAHGKYTPLVKSSELYVNLESLQDIEVVDTPGLNDPIASRAAKTKDFIAECDVVFLLSYCGSFLDYEDMALLSQNVPTKGIRDIVLIGSLFDSVLLDEYRSYPSITEAMKGLVAKLKNHAWQNFENIRLAEERKPEDSKDKVILQILQKSFPPVFISGMCYSIAKHINRLNQEESHVLKRLNAMYPDLTFDVELLTQLARIDKVEEKLENVRATKDKILAEKFENVLGDFSKSFKNELTRIQKTITDKYQKLCDGDIEALSQKQNTIIQKIQGGKTRVDGVFEGNIIKIEKEFAALLSDLKQAAAKAKRIRTQEGSETYSHEVSTSKWYNPFSWGSSRTVTRTINYTYANVHEALEQMEDYVLSAEDTVIKAIQSIVDLKAFRREILNSVSGMFDFSDDHFDPETILIPVENAVNRITIPEVNLNVHQHIETVRSKFNTSQVRNDEIATLRNEQSRVVELIVQDIQSEVHTLTGGIVTKLQDIRNTFIPGLIRDMQETLEEIKQQLNNKEKYKAQYESLLKQLEQDLGTCR
ncbi:MAG: dynamin family protein [SAR324 cluster bacterium]|nr:dynamin family protein [SAR324 cluster bacterium]